MKFRTLHERVVVKRIEGEEKSKSGNNIPNSSQNGDTIVVDKSYFRARANEALKTFFAPLSGVYDAAFGPISSQAELSRPQKTANRD